MYTVELGLAIHDGKSITFSEPKIKGKGQNNYYLSVTLMSNY